MGGSAGGPIKKNRVWWFGAYERTHISSAGTTTATVPLLPERQGIFGTRNVFDPLRADATIDSHRSDRIVPSGESWMWLDAKVPDLVTIG